MLAACALLAACGGGGSATTAKATAARLVSQAFTASGAVDSGRLELTVTLNLHGVRQLDGEPLAIDVSGPFQRTAAGGLSAALDATLSSASAHAAVSAILLPGHLYLGIGGTYYDLPRPQRDHRAGATGASGMLGALGVDPRGWLTSLRDEGPAEVAGVRTEHVRGSIDIAKLLALAGHGDTGAPATGATGATGTSGLAGLLPLLGQAVTSARADIYTGIDDHVLRRFDAAVAFTVPPLASGALDGLTGGSLHLDATLLDVGRPQTITPPANPQPRARLLNGVFDLESEFGPLASLVGGQGTDFAGLHMRHHRHRPGG